MLDYTNLPDYTFEKRVTYHIEANSGHVLTVGRNPTDECPDLTWLIERSSTGEVMNALALDLKQVRLLHVALTKVLNDDEKKKEGLPGIV